MGRVQPKELVQPEEQHALLEEPEKADLHWELGLDRVVLAYSLSCVNKHQQCLFIGKSAYTLTAAILFL